MMIIERTDTVRNVEDGGRIRSGVSTTGSRVFTAKADARSRISGEQPCVTTNY